MYNLYFKRIIDFSVAFLGLLFLTPILIFGIIILIKPSQGRLFFLQSRPGKDEQIFKIIKFKTMNDKKDCNGNLLPDAQRITKIGQLFRKASLDELPQLINVLKGDMSLIGPRPLLTEYLPLYNETQKRRHEVKPGITGWAQVNGRNTISWQQKFEYDVWYVDHISFLLDCKIIYLTLKKVFKREDITSVNSVSSQIFKGN